MNMTGPTEEKEPITRVRLDSIFPAKIVSFLQKRGKEEKLYVTDSISEAKYELVLNSVGNLCYLEGRNTKLIEGSGKVFYMDSDNLDRVEQAHDVDSAARFQVDEAPAVSEVNVDLVNAYRSIMGGRSVTRPVAKEVVRPRVAQPEIVRYVSSDRLKQVLTLIADTNGSYKIAIDYKGGGKKITSADGGNSASIIVDLQTMCREVVIENGELIVYLDFSMEEERVAREARFDVTIAY